MSVSETITDVVLTWDGVHATEGERGEWSFRVGKREIGHLHGDRVAHLGFPRAVGERLRAEGRIGPHPVFPDKPAWGARALHTDDDVQDVIALLRLNYERVIERHGVPA
jgi:hypothetical protein